MKHIYYLPYLYHTFHCEEKVVGKTLYQYLSTSLRPINNKHIQVSSISSFTTKSQPPIPCVHCALVPMSQLIYFIYKYIHITHTLSRIFTRLLAHINNDQLLTILISYNHLIYLKHSLISITNPPRRSDKTSSGVPHSCIDDLV